MTREQATALLPCYVAGDLPAPVLRDVEQTLAEHPELATRAEHLRRLHEAASRALMHHDAPRALRQTWGDTEPPVVRIELPGRPAAPPAPTRRRLVPLAAVAIGGAIALLLGLTWLLGPGQVPIASLPSIVFAHEAVESGRLEALPSDEPDVVARAFASAGVPAPLRAVPDLSAHGLIVESVFVVSGRPPAAAIAYRGPADRQVLYQGRLGQTPPARPATTRDLSETTLHGYLADDVALVIWRDGEILHTLSTRGDLDELLELAADGVAPTP